MDMKQFETHDYIIISFSFHGHVQNYDKMPNLEVPSLFVVFSLPHFVRYQPHHERQNCVPWINY